MIRKNKTKNGFTIMEILVTVSLVSIIVVLFTQMIQSGSTGMSYAMWYNDNLKTTQRFFVTLEKDLKEAASDVTMDYTKPVNGISINGNFFKYKKGAGSDKVEDATTGKIVNEPVIYTEKTETSSKKVFEFMISHLTVVSGPNKKNGYKIKVTGTLKGRKLLYSKKLVSGSFPTTDTSQYLFSDKVVLNNIKYIHISHLNLKTKLTGQIKGAIVYIYILFENDDILKGSKKTMSVKQSFKIDVAAKSDL